MLIDWNQCLTWYQYFNIWIFLHCYLLRYLRYEVDIFLFTDFPNQNFYLAFFHFLPSISRLHSLSNFSLSRDLFNFYDISLYSPKKTLFSSKKWVFGNSLASVREINQVNKDYRWLENSVFLETFHNCLGDKMFSPSETPFLWLNK